MGYFTFNEDYALVFVFYSSQLFVQIPKTHRWRFHPAEIWSCPLIAKTAGWGLHIGPCHFFNTQHGVWELVLSAWVNDTTFPLPITVICLWAIILQLGFATSIFCWAFILRLGRSFWFLSANRIWACVSAKCSLLGSQHMSLGWSGG